MNNSITEIAGLAIRSFEENFEKILTEKKDIAEFVMDIKKTKETPKILYIEADEDHVALQAWL